ncbi:MAG TPA: hypothetical protein VIS72_07170 [Anaerolineales bacterium]
MQYPLVITDRRGLPRFLLFIVLMSGMLVACLAPRAEDIAKPETILEVPVSTQTVVPTLPPKKSDLIFVEFFAIT